MIRPQHLFPAVALGGAFFVHERRMRRRAERFAAAALDSLLRAIDANDPQTGAHVRRVAEYALILAESLGIGERERRTIELAALFHDVGKIHEALFDVVHDPGKLSPAEWRAIRTHPIRGAEVLEPIAHFHSSLADVVLSHHERWDGKGYPRQLRGRRISLSARVVALADTFDVITYGRRYKSGRATSMAATIIFEGRGTQFDPELVDLMLFPPVFDQLVEAHRQLSRRGQTLPKRRESRGYEKAPNVEIRWRSLTGPPKPLREKMAAAR